MWPSDCWVTAYVALEQKSLETPDLEQVLVFCNCVYFCVYILFIFCLSCAYHIFSGMKVHSIVFSVLLCFSFVPHWLIFVTFSSFFVFSFYTLFKHILNHTKVLQSISIHSSVYINGHALSSVHFLHGARDFLFCFPNCAYLISICCFSTLFKKW